MRIIASNLADHAPNQLLVDQSFTGKQLTGNIAHLVYCVQAAE